MEPNAVENIAVVIQLSVAPVFLLAGIAACLMSCPFVWVGSSIGHESSKPG
jgi:hypothetical protein